MPGIKKRRPPRPGHSLRARWQANIDDFVIRLAWSPDGTLLAAAAVEGPITLLDARSGQVRHPLPGHGFGAADLSWHPEQGRLAHPHTEQRILGILELLSEQFGQPHAQGVRLEVRLTHQQLASAVGATRQTVTRLLGQLRALDRLAVVETPQGERFCLPHPPDSRHSFVSPPLLRRPQPNNGRG